MDLGTFSISLAVKDLDKAQAFYTKLGFEPAGGAADQGWLILRNGACTLGLFHGMFEGNMLTFNPGWNADTSVKEGAEDIRKIEARLQAEGIDFIQGTSGDSGPTSFVVQDPDGNKILVDQHV